jgi:hypothetical protein
MTNPGMAVNAIPGFSLPVTEPLDQVVRRRRLISMRGLPAGLARNEAERTGLLVSSHAGSHGGPAWSVQVKALRARRGFFEDIEIAGSFAAGA